MKISAIRAEWTVAGIVLLVGLLFAAFTGHIWEDYWITFRASRNLATGNGLVYTPGERLHTFTSPLGTLLPAALSWLTGNQSDELVLWFFRFISLAALAGGIVLLFRMMQSLQLRRVSCWLTVALIGLDAKIVDFSINGMETGLLIFFLGLTIHGLIVAGSRQMWRIGVGWAGLMWTRPDSCIYIAILGVGALLFLSGKNSGKSPIAWGKLLVGAGVICAALYLWWFVWAWCYYGSPIPHTIIAKAANKPHLLPVDIITMMWTRPDSYIYIAILGVGALLFLSGKKSGKSPVAWGKLIFVAGLICAALFVSWFVWAWWNHGSSSPHTIIAKAANNPYLIPLDFITSLLKFPFSISSLQVIFLPGYSDHGGWPRILVFANCALGLLASFAWLIPGLHPQTKLFSLAFLLGNFYLTVILKYFPPWYLPTVEVFGYLTAGLFFDQLLCVLHKLQQQRWAGRWLCHLQKVLRLSAVALIIGQAAVTVCVARQLQVQQQLIENGVRRPIGLWLHDHARTPHDTVMLEPLGYIGYYSGLKMLDYPGLASKEMVEARKRLGPTKENLAYLELKPDWVVLRPWESQGGIYVEIGGLRKYYELVKVFDATDKINAVRWLPGRPYVEFDETFEIYHRKADISTNSPD